MKRFGILFIALLSLCACSNDGPDTPNKIDEPTLLQINENALTVKSTGGEYAFTYVVEGGSEIPEITVTCEDVWIHDFNTSVEGVVSFVVDQNISSSRITRVTIACGKLKDSIVVSQGAMSGNADVSFEITYDIDGPYVTMHVTPEPEGLRYFAWYYEKALIQSALDKSPGVTLEMYLKKWIEVDISNAIYYGAYAGYSTEQAVAEITLVGPSSQNFELNGNTDFYGFVCAVHDSGQIISDLTITEFRTGPVEPSDNQISINVTDVNSDRISYNVTTTNMDQYATLVLAAETIEGLSDDELVEFYNNIKEYINYLRFGDSSATILVDKPDTDYYVLAFGYEYGMATTEIHKEKVHTLVADGKPADKFEFTINKVTHFRINATVEAIPATCLYYVDCCYADEDAEALKKNVRDAAQWYVDVGYYSNLADCMKVVGTKGKQTVEFDMLTGNTDYKVYAIGIDETTGEFNTDVIFSDVITTPEQKQSESYISIECDKYFDGFDLKDAYPSEFSDADGWAVVPIEVEVHGDVVDYYYDIYLDDLTGADGPDDIALILDLEMYGNHNTPITMSYCYFYESLTLVYFSKDGDDNNSAVTRVPLYLNPEKCSPVSEFNYLDGAAKSKSLRKLGN